MTTKPTKTVRDIMNAKVLYISQGERPSLARRHILTFGVTAVPVLDETHRPVGVVSLRDLQSHDDEAGMQTIVVTVKDTDSVEDGARKLAETEHHHLVVVDAKGVAVGMVSSMDFLRALLGLEPRHPKAFDKL
jgi:CBS-domain-containing membrane protein